MPTKKKKFNARFPPARIKKIMQTDEEVGKVAAAVPVIISKALEMFMQNLMIKASEYTQARNAKTMTTSHLKWCITSEQQFDFLKDLVESVPDLTMNEEDGDGETKPKRRKGQPCVNHERKKRKQNKPKRVKPQSSESDDSESEKRIQNKQKAEQPQSSESEDDEQESEEEGSGSSEHQNNAVASAGCTDTSTIPTITLTRPDSEQADKVCEPPGLSISVPNSGQLSFGMSVQEEEDDDYDS